MVIMKRWNIDIDGVFLLGLHKDLCQVKRFVSYGRAKAFFAHACVLRGRQAYDINHVVDDVNLISDYASNVKVIPQRLSNPSEVALTNLFEAIKTTIMDYRKSVPTRAVNKNDAVGPGVPAGINFNTIWGQFTSNIKVILQTLPNPSEVAWINFSQAIKSTIEDYRKGIRTEAIRKNDAVGPGVLTGTNFNTIWGQFASKSGIDSARLMVAEFVRLMEQEAYQEREEEMKVLDEIIRLLDSVEI